MAKTIEPMAEAIARAAEEMAQAAAARDKKRAAAVEMFIRLMKGVHDLTPDSFDWVLRGIGGVKPPSMELYRADNWRERQAVHGSMESAIAFLEMLYNDVDLDDPIVEAVCDGLAELEGWLHDLETKPAADHVPEPGDSAKQAEHPCAVKPAAEGTVKLYSQEGGSFILVAHVK